MMPISRRLLVLAALSCAVSTTQFATAQCGDSNFDYTAYAPSAAKNVSSRIQSVAGKLAVVEGEKGKTLLPKGTAIDFADVVDGFLTLKVTLPAGVNTITQEQAYTSLDVMRYQFAESESLRGGKLFARLAGETEYQPVDAFIPEAQGKEQSRKRAAEEINYEIDGPGPQPTPDYKAWYARMRGEGAGGRNVSGQGSLGTTGNQFGPLTGITVFTYGGHGRTWDGDASTPYWRWQRGYVNNMLEDFGNTDAVEFFVPYLLNAGATVVPIRPIGFQNNEVIVDNPAATFSGSWSNSVNTRFYGSGTPYRYVTCTATETATATYTPNIPSAGYYPVYTWVNTGSDRVPGQLYRIKTSGGESLIRVNHRRVGRGWVYLGTYYFYAGSNPTTGSVVVSNMLPTGAPPGSYIAIADAIRFGNGMGDVDKGDGVSGYSRREESTVYWVQSGWGNGDTSADSMWDTGNAYDDETQSWNTPGKFAAYMNQLESTYVTPTDYSDAYKYAIYLGWHSNASGGSARGSEGLITTSTTANQADWAAMVSDEIDADSLVEDANWENTWYDKASSTYTGGYGELSNYNFDDQTPGGEMDATIIEVAYHDNVADAELMRDPKVRNVHGRSAYKAVVRYFNQYQGTPLAFLPEPPVRFRAANNGSGGVTLGWAAGPVTAATGQAATGYRIYRSPDGLNFDSGTAVAGLSTTVTGLTVGSTYYFRVTGTNAGGESLPSEVLAVRVRAPGSPKVLIVNGYDRLDRFNNIDRAISSNVVEQLILERNNSYNYVRQHAAAISAAGLSFDSCSNEAVISGDVSLGTYETLVWILGEESSADDTFGTTERTAVQNFLNSGNKRLFLSGAETGYELDGQAVAASFYNNYLAADYGGDDGGSYQATGVAGTIFAGITMNFPASSTMYDADYPDRLNAFGGSVVAANYTSGGSGGAAVQFSGGSPARRIVNLGFPFEAIDSSTTRNQVMAAAMTFFGTTEPVSGVENWELY